MILAKEMLRNRFNGLIEQKEADFVYNYDKNTRFGVNMFFQINELSAVFRVIPAEIKSLDNLKMPNVLYEIVKFKLGLVFL